MVPNEELHILTKQFEPLKTTKCLAPRCPLYRGSTGPLHVLTIDYSIMGNWE